MGVLLTSAINASTIPIRRPSRDRPERIVLDSGRGTLDLADRVYRAGMSAPPHSATAGFRLWERWPKVTGAVAGTLPFLMLLVVDLARTPVTEAEFFDWPGSILLFGGFAVTPLVLVAGLVLTIGGRTRRVGVGLLVGGTIAAAVSLYAASEVLPAIPSLRH
jgi:hypothetical protein